MYQQTEIKNKKDLTRQGACVTISVKGGNVKKEVLEYLKEIGAKGGKATGKSKVRGDSAYYRRLREKGIRKQRGRK